MKLSFEVSVLAHVALRILADTLAPLSDPSVTDLYSQCLKSEVWSLKSEVRSLKSEVPSRLPYGSSSVLYIKRLLYIKRACELNKSHIISTDEDPGLRIESFAVINLRGVSTNKTIIYFIAMQTYKELIRVSMFTE
jgi:hypothetical protein